MKLTASGRGLAAGLVLGLAAGAGGIAYATIPDSDNVIHACYSPNGSKATNGTQLNIIDSPTAACSKGQAEVTWGQTGPEGAQGDTGATGATGPAGPAGPSAAYTNYGDGLHDIAEGATQTVASLTLPAGNYTLMATAHVNRDGDTRFAQCTLTPGNVNSTFTLFPLHAVGGIRLPVMGDVTAPNGTTVYLRCWGIDGAVKATGNVTATQVGSITPSE